MQNPQFIHVNVRNSNKPPINYKRFRCFSLRCEFFFFIILYVSNDVTFEYGVRDKDYNLEFLNFCER